jgi:hypothetical protein
MQIHDVELAGGVTRSEAELTGLGSWSQFPPTQDDLLKGGINDIAEQTNLLALNAIEPARPAEADEIEDALEIGAREVAYEH